MSDEPVFVDTNVLVYAHDRQAGAKHDAAKEKVKALWSHEPRASLSVQVLQELYVSLVKKRLTNDEARETVTDYTQWHIVANDRRLLSAGIEERERWGLSLWDALIIAAAKRCAAKIIWSEDLNAGQDSGGVVVVNPLLPA
jgi:predicted nucleic acid-binding protein